MNIDRTLYGAVLGSCGDDLLSGKTQYDFFRPFMSVDKFSEKYASLLFYKTTYNNGRSIYIVAHIQGNHIQPSASRIYNTRLVYEISAEDFKNCGYDFYSVLNALPEMQKYQSEKDIKPLENPFEIKKIRLSNSVLLKQCGNILENLKIYDKKRVLIKLEDDETICYENGVREHKVTKNILAAASNLPDKKYNFAFAVDKKYERENSASSINNEHFNVITYYGDIAFTADDILLRWDGKKLIGDKKYFEIDENAKSEYELRKVAKELLKEEQRKADEEKKRKIEEAKQKLTEQERQETARREGLGFLGRLKEDMFGKKK